MEKSAFSGAMIMLLFSSFQPPEDVACVSWNRQVQHILASTFAARCVVWDLRKNEPIIKVSDSMSRVGSSNSYMLIEIIMQH